MQHIKTQLAGLLFLVTLIGLAFLFVFYESGHVVGEPAVIVGVVKTATHEALNAAEYGFIEKMRALDPQISFIKKNAEGSVQTLSAIAEDMTHEHIQLFYVIATPALEAIARQEKNKPIVFVAVTDPGVLSLQDQDNVCGITDSIDERTFLDAVFRAFSGERRFVVLYNPAELNSANSTRKLLNYAIQQQKKMISYAVSSAVDISSVIEQLQKNDCVILPADNLLASAISFIARLLAEKEIPFVSLFPTEESCVNAGINYQQAGEKAAEIAIELLKGQKKPESCGVMSSAADSIRYNKSQCAMYGAQVPDSYS
jgi:putative tryptophan/tyrosine transport system substrate-binding protein